jgi:hypothetical protein
MIWRFLRSRAFHAAGGDVLDSGSGDREEWLRGERWAAGGFIVGGGERGTRCTGAGSISGSARGNTGGERHDRSIESIVGETRVSSVGCEVERSSVSTSGDADFVFLRRGDVRRLCAAGAVSFELLRLVMRDELGKDESEEEFVDIEVSGGRAWTGAAARRELVAAAGYDLDGAIRGGDERVKSNSSTSLRDG